MGLKCWLWSLLSPPPSDSKCCGGCTFERCSDLDTQQTVRGMYIWLTTVNLLCIYSMATFVIIHFSFLHRHAPSVTHLSFTADVTKHFATYPPTEPRTPSWLPCCHLLACNISCSCLINFISFMSVVWPSSSTTWLPLFSTLSQLFDHLKKL